MNGQGKEESGKKYGLNLEGLRKIGLVAYVPGTTPCKTIPETAAFPVQDWKYSSWAVGTVPVLPRAISLKILGNQVAAFLHEGKLHEEVTVFEQGAPLPQRRTLILAVSDEREDVEFVLCSGTSRLGACHLVRLGRANGERRVELVFSLDIRGNLSAAARWGESREWLRFDLPEASAYVDQMASAA